MQNKKHIGEKEVEQYLHDDKKRSNNPPVGLVTSETDHSDVKRTYKFDPHLDPQLYWAGKIEEMAFDIDTISLHVHQRVDPLTIIQVIKKKELQEQQTLFHYFESPENNRSIREAIEFYKHSLGWSNRLIAGDSLLVMNSLLEKEGLAGKVQMIYMDPPYGIKYSSNFQPFVNKSVVKDQNDEDLTREPEMIKAFRDIWELGIHSYLTYLRKNLLLIRQLLTESGSVFVQISDENIHHVREIMDEIFGTENFIRIIFYRTKSNSQQNDKLTSMGDFVLWYAKNKKQVKYHALFVPKDILEDVHGEFKYIIENKKHRQLTEEEKNNLSFLEKHKEFIYRSQSIMSKRNSKNKFDFVLNDRTYKPGLNLGWIPKDIESIKRLVIEGRFIETEASNRLYRQFWSDFPYYVLNNVWMDVMAEIGKNYVVQTSTKIIQRCLLMTTDPGDLVLDPTCGSGTTAFVAEQWGRRWITCDTSRVAITLAKQRLMTAVFDYYELVDHNEGISSGFSYNKVSHITLNSIANNEPPEQEILYDQPHINKYKKRVTGPFTVEAIPSIRVISFEEVEHSNQADMHIARSGETLKENEWIDELLATRIEGNQNIDDIEFIRIEPLQGTKWIHAEGETKDGHRAIISFGPKYAPLEQRQVELAIHEAESIVPKPKLVIFASFQFDPEAAKDIDNLKWPGISVLKVQMNPDLLTLDLKKNKKGNESFWLVGQPDIRLIKQEEKYIVEVRGFDYYNTRTSKIESGDVDKIAIWELDTDYDGRSLYPRQVFFPMSGQDDGWSKLAKNLKGYIDEDLVKKYQGNISLPFKIGTNRQVAVKIIDDRGIESLRIIRIDK